jgi:hypothetical protein
VSSHPPDEQDAPPVFRESVTHNPQLGQANDKACRTAAIGKESCQQPRTNRTSRTHVKIPTNPPIMKAMTFASMTRDPLSSPDAIDSPQHEHWKRAMAEECTVSLLKNTFTTVNFRKARQLPVKPIGSS